MKRIFVILIALSGCSPSVTKTTQKEAENARPQWLSAKPQTGSYYVGIGHGIKGGTNNYVQEAKKSALEDGYSQKVQKRKEIIESYRTDEIVR